MKLTLTQRLIALLQRLTQGESIPYSSIPKSLADSLLREGLVTPVYHGSRRSLRAGNIEVLSAALPRYNEALTDLDAVAALFTVDGSRAAQASISGNSKARSERTCPGFLVNSHSRVDCTLRGHPLTVEPPEGSAVYVSDWESFVPPTSALIIGVENMENFLKIREQRVLTGNFLLPGEKDVLFVARYSFSNDLGRWLERIPNRYLHFGDFDLAGISIFLTQFAPYVGSRGSFLIPSDIEERIRNGSRQRYDDQYAKYSSLTAPDHALQSLLDLIHHYRRCYDQEGYIGL